MDQQNFTDTKLSVGSQLEPFSSVKKLLINFLCASLKTIKSELTSTSKLPSMSARHQSSWARKAIFRVSPLYLVRLTADFLKTLRKVSSVISCQSLRDIDNKSGCG